MRTILRQAIRISGRKRTWLMGRRIHAQEEVQKPTVTDKKVKIKMVRLRRPRVARKDE